MKTCLLFLFSLLLSVAGIAQNIPSARETEMMNEINYVRTNPEEYAQYVSDYLEYWDSDRSEIAAADELVKELRKMKPLDSLKFSQELYDAAVKHGKWMKSKAQFEHSDYDYGENLVAGDSTVRFAMLNLLIDSGVSGRGHRKNILDPEYKHVAVREVPGRVGEWKYVFIQEFE
jgi:uncharacterized protein YkwD